MKGIVLLVEDDEIFSSGFERACKRNSYTAVHFDSSKEAIRFIKEGARYDAAVIDRSLDERTYGNGGDDVIDVSRAFNPNIPILSISGYDGKPSNSNRHLVKPFTPQDVINIIDGWV